MDERDDRKAVCNRCHVVVDDSEPFATHGEFMHPRNGCEKSGKLLSTGRPSGNVAPNRSATVNAVPFMRKSERRRWSRAQRRASKLAR